jgi:hypothetical protein
MKLFAMRLSAGASILVALVVVLDLAGTQRSGEALAIIMAQSGGNIICLLLNSIYLKLAGGPDWLRVLVFMQLIPAAVFCTSLILGVVFL